MIPYLLFYKIVQLFAVMFLGFALVKFKVLKGSNSMVLSKIALYLLMPAVLINSFDVELDTGVKRGLVLAFGAAIIIHIVLLIIDMLYKKLANPGGAERASVIYSNAANLIIPIVGYILGDEWVIYSCAFVSVQIICIWTHGIRLFESSSKVNVRKIIFNPNIIATVAGLILMIFGLRLPGLVKEVSSSLGSMVGNVGMLIAGMLMADVDFKKVFSSKRVYIAVAMRMIVCPFIALMILKGIRMVVDIPNMEKILLISFLSSMTPSASMVTQLAQVHNSGEELAVSINIFSTLVCIITMPVFVMLY